MGVQGRALEAGDDQLSCRAAHIARLPVTKGRDKRTMLLTPAFLPLNHSFLPA
jgi:hypothetical protein